MSVVLHKERYLKITFFQIQQLWWAFYTALPPMFPLLQFLPLPLPPPRTKPYPSLSILNAWSLQTNGLPYFHRKGFDSEYLTLFLSAFWNPISVQASGRWVSMPIWVLPHRVWEKLDHCPHSKLKTAHQVQVSPHPWRLWEGLFLLLGHPLRSAHRQKSFLFFLKHPH